MKYKITIIALLIFLGICGGILFYWCQKETEETKPYQELSEIVKSKDEAEQESAMHESVTIQEISLIDDIKAEIIGWIRNGNYIDYPIVSTDDEAYYLTHDVLHNDNRAGAIFCANDNKYFETCHNTVLYGHNMGNGRTDMFSTLLRFKDEEYYRENKEIIIATESGRFVYEVFAAFPIDIYKDDFNYTIQDFNTDSEYDRFIEKARERIPYQINTEVKTGAPIITMVTCDRSVDQVSGRYIVMATLDSEKYTM